jgi:hypothetical protein
MLKFLTLVLHSYACCFVLSWLVSLQDSFS